MAPAPGRSGQQLDDMCLIMSLKLKSSGIVLLSPSVALRLQTILESSNHKRNVGGSGIEAHDSNAPHLASAWAQPTCNLQIVLAHDIVVEAKPVNAFWYLQVCTTA